MRRRGLDFQHNLFNGAPVTSNHEKYLGLPVLIGRNKTAAFDYLRERIRGRIQGWSKRFLSRVGKEIMLKIVIQMIPSYVMSVFRIPHSLWDVLEKIMNSYWWDAKLRPEEGSGGPNGEHSI